MGRNRKSPLVYIFLRELRALRGKIQKLCLCERQKMEKVKSKYSTCSGPSMLPTLTSGDGLRLSKYKDNSEIKVGDVIVYPHPDKPFDVVHRIIKIKPIGVITRGDNNNKVDPYLIKFEEIQGKVLSAKRKTKMIYMRNGRLGYYRHRYLVIKKFLWPYIVMIPAKLSRPIKNHGLLNFLHPCFKLKVITVKRGNRTDKILSSRNKPIGKFNNEKHEWDINFPYKFFCK